LEIGNLARKADTGLSKRQSPYGIAFIAAMNAVLRDEVLGPIARRDGISFVLEGGNHNNSGIVESYQQIKQQHRADFLKSITTVSKSSCVAIQMADLGCDVADTGLLSVLASAFGGLLPFLRNLEP
jgi:hypothetical protein